MITEAGSWRRADGGLVVINDVKEREA